MIFRIQADENEVRVYRPDDKEPCVRVTEDHVYLKGWMVRSRQCPRYVWIALWIAVTFISYVLASQMAGFDMYWFVR